ncbi:hypothetical protein R1flu_011213 [Riccia fluitans]|uniref:Uncharacterized protein n=1 Tax=Riccia fluitans TaxID=41844 RepID=A0ABD1Z760_9MARC
MFGRGRWIVGHMHVALAAAPPPSLPVPASTLHTWAVIVAGIFVLIALALSTFLMFEHLTSYKDPEEQKWLIGLIFMVPVYTISSFFSLWHPNYSLVCNILGNCYEAYALYAFGCYLIACLGGEEKVVELFEREGKQGARTPLLENKSGKRADVEHPVPLNWCIEPWELGQDFYTAAKFGIVQYMILKTLCALLALVFNQVNWYNEGNFRYNDGYPYITLVLNFSQTWALYCLIQFYGQTHEELKDINPLAKFVCFKSIVFATWWQGVVISIAFGSGWFKVDPDIFSGKFQTALQDFLVCFEMAIAAVAHIYIFPATPYQRLGQERRRGSVSVLADYASIDSPLDPEEVKESERHSVVKVHETSHEGRHHGGTSVRESVQDVLIQGGNMAFRDVKETVHIAVAPVEEGINKMHGHLPHLPPWGKKKEKVKEKKRTMSKDDLHAHYSHSSPGGPVRGIDDPLFGRTGSMSDGQVVGKTRRSYGSGAESSGESSDQGLGGFKTGGKRWTYKK